jgi:3-oxoadipate enol-lactonase
MPGYGPSRPLAALSFEGLAGAVERLLDRAGIERVHLVGHSIGGMVAQIFAASRGERLASLTLSATSPVFGSRDGTFQREFLHKRLKPLDEGLTPADFAADLVAELVGPAPDPDGVRRAVESMAKVRPESYRAALLLVATFDARALLPGITAPTLLLAGSHDTNAPPAMMERMAAKIPHGRFALCEGAGHLANLERPQAFNLAVATFLDSVETKAGL